MLFLLINRVLINRATRCIMSSCCDILFMFGRFIWVKHIRSVMNNKLDYGSQYVTEFESYVF